MAQVNMYIWSCCLQDCCSRFLRQNLATLICCSRLVHACTVAGESRCCFLLSQPSVCWTSQHDAWGTADCGTGLLNTCMSQWQGCTPPTANVHLQSCVGKARSDIARCHTQMEEDQPLVHATVFYQACRPIFVVCSIASSHQKFRNAPISTCCDSIRSCWSNVS